MGDGGGDNGDMKDDPVAFIVVDDGGDNTFVVVSVVVQIDIVDEEGKAVSVKDLPEGEEIKFVIPIDEEVHTHLTPLDTLPIPPHLTHHTCHTLTHFTRLHTTHSC